MLKTRLEKFNDKVVSEDLILLYNIKNISQLKIFDQGTISCTSNRFILDESSFLDTFCKYFLCFLKKMKITKAHRSIAWFNIREKDILGLKINLRKKNLFQFLDKLLIFTGQELPKQDSALFINDPVFRSKMVNSSSEDKRGLVSQSNAYNSRISRLKINEDLYLASSFTIKSNQKDTIGIFPEVFFFNQGKNKSGQISSFFSKYSFSCLIKTFYKLKNTHKNGDTQCNLRSKNNQTMHCLNTNLLSQKGSINFKTIDHKNQMKKVFVSAFQFPIV